MENLNNEEEEMENSDVSRKEKENENVLEGLEVKDLEGLTEEENKKMDDEADEAFWHERERERIVLDREAPTRWGANKSGRRHEQDGGQHSFR